MRTTANDPVDAVLAVGLKDLWYPICPSEFVAERPVSLRRLGKKFVLWREANGTLHALEDHCPHRGAPLSMGIAMGDRIACGYHGVQVRFDGVVMSVPGSPGCKLEGAKATRSYHVTEACGAIFLFYTEWKGDYRYVLDNVMDPMHGTFLHKQSHSMAEGDNTASFGIRETDIGFVFEKEGQRDVNFDWTEWADTDLHWMRLAIPYPKTGGPGGSFVIVGSYTPIVDNVAAVFHWRCRKLTGWQKDTWRFLYRNRLEARHWNVLEQDRVVLELMEPDANQREMLYQHDIGIVRLRRHMRNLAKEQLAREEEMAAAKNPVKAA